MLELIKNYSLIVSIGTGIIFIISLFMKNKFERTIQTDQMNVLRHISRIVIFILVSTVGILQIIDLTSVEKFKNIAFEEQLEIIKLLLIFNSLFVPAIYSLTYSIFLSIPKRFIYIKDDTYEKLYIIKAVSKEEILLSNDIFPYDKSIQILQTKDFLIGKEVLVEVRKEKIIPLVANRIIKRFSKKQ